jgi:hypothetical protein
MTTYIHIPYSSCAARRDEAQLLAYITHSLAQSYYSHGSVATAYHQSRLCGCNAFHSRWPAFCWKPDPRRAGICRALDPAIAGRPWLGMLRVRTDGSVIRDSCLYRYRVVVSPTSIANIEKMLTVILVIAEPRRTVIPETSQNGLAVERESSKERL